MEEQTAPNNTPTNPIPNQPIGEEKKENTGKTGLLAGVFIVLVVLFGLGFIFLRGGNKETSTPATNSSNQVSQADPLNTAVIDSGSDLTEIDNLTKALNSINTANDNEPSY